MIDFLATLIFTLGIIPMLLLIIITFITSINGITALFRPHDPERQFYMKLGVIMAVITTVAVHYYLQALRYLWGA